MLRQRKKQPPPDPLQRSGKVREFRFKLNGSDKEETGIHLQPLVRAVAGLQNGIYRQFNLW